MTIESGADPALVASQSSPVARSRPSGFDPGEGGRAVTAHDICERLRARADVPDIGMSLGTPVMVGIRKGTGALINPDGPEAADLIEELGEALARAISSFIGFMSATDQERSYALLAKASGSARRATAG